MQQRSLRREQDLSVGWRRLELLGPEPVAEEDQPLVAGASPVQGQIPLIFAVGPVDQEVGMGQRFGASGVALEAFESTAGEEHGGEPQLAGPAQQRTHGLGLLGGLATEHAQAVDAAAADRQVLEQPLDRRYMGQVRHVLHDFHLAYCNVQLAAAPRIRLAIGDQAALARVAEGLKAEAIGYELGITSRAVEERLARVRKQLRCRTTTEAVAKAVVLGLIL